MGAIDKEHVKGIINYFLEGTDKKYEKKKGSHTATVRVLTGYLLNANKNSRMTAKRLQIRHEPSWIDGEKCLPTDRTRWQVERTADMSHRNEAM